MLIVLAKNCTDDPVQAPNTDKGNFDWDLNVRNKSYSIQINYWWAQGAGNGGVISGGGALGKVNNGQ